VTRRLDHATIWPPSGELISEQPSPATNYDFPNEVAITAVEYMGENIQKLVERKLDLIPQEVKPFLNNADGDVEARNFTTMGFMAYAYGQAFEELAEPALAQWPKRDFMTQPMVYLARHSMELHLKRTIGHYQKHLGDKTPTDHHSLLKLWYLMTKLVRDAGYIKDDEYGNYCVKLLNHVHEPDPDGDRYRYLTISRGSHTVLRRWTSKAW
jgi:hypothetical protein